MSVHPRNKPKLTSKPKFKEETKEYGGMRFTIITPHKTEPLPKVKRYKHKLVIKHIEDVYFDESQDSPSVSNFGAWANSIYYKTIYGSLECVTGEDVPEQKKSDSE